MEINQNLLTILQIIVTIIVAFITAQLTNQNERKKQATIFFKQEGIKQQSEVLNFWCSILFKDYELTIKKYKSDNKDNLLKEYNLNNENEITDSMAIKFLQRESYIYSSKITVKYISRYMQEIYKTKKNPNSYKQMFLVGKIISNMKYDFTGEKVSVMDLLKIRLNDLNIFRRTRIYFYELKYFVWRV